jgi:uncharacterized coiled-coil protein SlyX
MVVAAARTHTIDAEAHGRATPSQADLVLRLAWFAAAVGVQGQQMLDQIRAAHADALAAIVETQWRMRDAARDQVARVNGALADARAEIDRLTATVARLEVEATLLKASLAEAPPTPMPPHRASAERVRGRRSLLILMKR